MGREYGIACEQEHLGQFSAGTMKIFMSGNKPVTVMSLWDKGGRGNALASDVFQFLHL